MSATPEPDPDPMELDEADDLFGDDDEEVQSVKEKKRELDDDDLESGVDLGRNDRETSQAMAVDNEEGELEYEIRERAVLDCPLIRHPIPRPSDGELNSLRIPPFLGIAPRAYDPETYNIPNQDHHRAKANPKLSPSEIAASTMFYRKNAGTGKLESNTLIYKWSDGSTTIQVGDEHYEIDIMPLAQPKSTKYKPEFDSNTYLACPQLEAMVLPIVGHFSNRYEVRPNEDLQDDAIEILQHRMLEATRGRYAAADGKGNLVATTEDPELQKKKAEAAEKERMKIQRRREAAQAKSSQASRARGSHAPTNDLDQRAAAKKPSKSRPRTRYDDSDEDRPRGRGKEDEYDLEDDFLASSDDEELVEGDDDDEEELLDDDESDRGKRKSKGHSKAKEDDSDMDADGEADTDLPSTFVAETTSRNKRRNVIEDDEDED